MTFGCKLAIATLLIGTACAPAEAAPIAPSPIAPDANVQQVQYRHWHGGLSRRWVAAQSLWRRRRRDRRTGRGRSDRRCDRQQSGARKRERVLRTALPFV